MFLDWPVDPCARFDQSRPSLSAKVPNDGQQRGALPASTRSRWRKNALQPPPQVLQRIAGWDGCGPFLPEVCGVLLGTPGVSLDQFFLSRRTENSNSNISRSYLTTTTCLCLQEVHGRDEYLQAIQVLAPRFRFFGTFFPGNENAGGSAICTHRDLLLEEAVVTHLITCQGRDHMVNMQSGRQSLVIVNVHFEPERTLRQLRDRLHLINPHWPSYPNAVGIILGDFNICDAEEGRFNVRNQTFTDGDPRKTAMFH